MSARRLALVAALLVIITAGPAVAAPQGQELSVGGGFSYLREFPSGGGPGHTYPKGWLAAVTIGPSASRLSFMGEVGAQYRTNQTVEKQRLYAFLGGVRFALVRTPRWSVAALAQVGLERFTEPGFSESGFAIQPGASFDWFMTKALGLRVQGDFRLAREEATLFKEARVAVSVVYRRGGR